MILEPVVITALVALISAIVKAYLPQFPISDALINTVVVALLSWLGVELAKYAIPTKTADALRERKLIK